MKLNSRKNLIFSKSAEQQSASQAGCGGANNHICWEVQIMELIITQFFSVFC
jgi:hypothetical protein